MKSRLLAYIPFVVFAALPLAAQVNLPRWGHVTCPNGCGGGPFVKGNFSVNAAVVNPYLGQATDLHLEFPIYTRNTGTPAQLQAVLVYDSQFWQENGSSWYPQTGNGWWLRTVGGQLLRTEEQDDGACGWSDGDGDDGSGSIYYFTFTLQEPDGSSVAMGTVMESSPSHGRHDEDYYWDCPTGDTLPETFNSGDGKGYTVVVNGSYDDVTGTAWDGAGDEVDDGFIDRHGNTVKDTSGTWTDPLGTVLTVSGSGTPSSPVVYTYTGVNGASEKITVLYESTPATTTFGCFTNWSGDVDVPEAIEYPDGETYSFTYDSAGRLASVTQPTGATVSYSYTLGVECSPFYITDSLTQTDSLDSGTGWYWSHDTSTNQEVQTDPYNNATITTFDDDGNVLSEQVNNGGQYDGTEISNTAMTGTIYSPTWTTELFGSTNLYSAHAVSLDALGMVTSTSDTDWGNGAPGSVLRKTANTYSVNVSGHGEVLASAEVEDGSGNQVSKSTFSNFDTDGDPQTENDYVTSSTYLTTTFTYGANGTLATRTEPNTAETKYYYTCGASPYLLLSSVTAVEGTTSATWNCTGAVVTSTTDLNSETTTYTYSDPTGMWRPTSVTLPDSTVIDYTYPTSSSSFTQSEQAMAFNSGASANDVVTALDGLGRTILEQTRQAPGSGNFDSVATCYDAMGRAVYVTLPYTGTEGQYVSSCSSPPVGTKTQYDGLSRVTKVTDSGGGETLYAYNQNDVLSTVEGTTGAPSVSRQEETDGLGRLKSVCEVTAGTSAWPSGSCGQTYAETGYLTTYMRNPLGSITGVAQNAQGTGSYSESRTYAFDELGRMTAETNPETKQNTVSYTFDSDSTCGSYPGDLVKRVDDNGSGNVTCYAHDQAHRVTEISYPSVASGFVTPANKYFVYGDSGTVTVDGYTMQHANGRLAEAYTGSRATDLGFSYPSPDVETAYQASPDSGGWYVTTLYSYPNGAPEELIAPGVPNITYGLDGEGRANQVGASSGTNPVTAASYSALGLTSLTLGSGDSDAYSYDANTGRMTQWTFAVGSPAVTDTGNPTWNANGELEKLQVTDNISGTSDSQYCDYTHDDMGRLASMASDTGGTCLWGQTFSFDPFGNVAKTASVGTSFSASFNSYNQISSDGNVSGVYDFNGNLLNDPVQQTTTQVNYFDPDGKMAKLEGVSVLYDALDRPVEAGGQEFLYAPDGTKLGVMSGQTLVRADIPLPGGGEAVYDSSGLDYFRHADELGSARLSTYPNHTAVPTAYAPYGEEETSSGVGYRSFTGKKQDIDSSHSGGQDDFPAREYSPTQSRWWAPDPAGLAAVDPESPQSWNRYAYADCDPTRFTDPSGMDTCTVNVNIADYANAQADEGAIQNQINSIFAATPTSDGNITQVQFVGSGASYTLNLFAANLTGPGESLSIVQGEGEEPGPNGWVFMQNATAYAAAGGNPGAADLIAGTDAAHELVHQVTGTHDLPDTEYGDELMSFDSASPSQAGTVFDDFTNSTPIGFSKLSQNEANSLYTNCIQNQLKKPKQSSSAAGGGGFYDEPWFFWYLEVLNSQPPPTAPKDPCPYGDCSR